MRKLITISCLLLLTTAAYAELPSVATDKYEAIPEKKPWQPPKWHPPLKYFSEEQPMPLRRKRIVTRPLFEMAVFGGIQKLDLSTLSSSFDIAQFSRGTYFALETHYLFTPVFSVFTRFESLTARKTVTIAGTTSELDANLSSLPISLGIAYQPFSLSSSFFLSLSVMGGYALNSQFSVGRALPLATSQISQGVPYVAGKATVGVRVSNLGYALLEAGYRRIKISSSSPNVNGSLISGPADVNLGGIYTGLGFALLMY